VIHHQHVDLRVQASPGLPQYLLPVFFNATVASGCTLTELESRETHGYPFIRDLFFLEYVKNPFQHPVLAQRLIRT
jgi:hypothetical protein